MNELTKIYCLGDPVTGEIRYVGLTCRDLPSRLWEHINESRWNLDTPKQQWILLLLLENLAPTISLIMEVESKLAGEAESYWISYFKSIGSPLTNTSNGDRNPEIYLKVSASLKGIKRSPEYLQKQSMAQKIAQSNPITKEKKRQKLLGHPTSEETKNKISAAFQARRRRLQK